VAASEATDADCSEVLELLLKEKGLTDVAPAPAPLRLGDLADESARSAEVIVEIGRCANVNSIASEDPLTFEPGGITLVYGHNAAGKSSYARALKSIARAAHREPVLPNLFAPSPTKEPQAVVEVEVDGVRSPHIVSFANPQLVLPSTTVFDGRCASAYLGSRRKVEFTPIPLLLFGRAASAQQRLQELVDARIGALRQSRPSMDGFPASSTVRQTFESWSAVPTEERVRELATISDPEREKLAQLRLEVAAAQAGAAPATVARLRTSAAQLTDLASKAEAIAGALSDDVEGALSAARARVRTANEAVELARGRAFANEPLQSSGSAGWNAMWEAARVFVATDCGHVFPPVAEGDVCPLCQQPLGEDARERLQRFEEFVVGAVEEEARAAVAALADLVAACNPQALSAISEAQVDALEADAPEVVGTLRGWLADARARSNALREGGDAQALAAAPADLLRGQARQHLDSASHLEGAVNDPEQMAATQQAIDEADARVQLETRLDEMLTWRKNAAAIAKLETIKSSDLSTTSLSLAFGNLAREVVNAELRDAIKRELAGLRFAHLKIDLSYRTERGEATAQMSLDGASQNKSLSDVLSESEQRACALAFFLAEALMSASEGPVVLDDPASSFDAERIAQISKRIVELAKKRKQVIVFTHHVAFGWALQQVAKQEGVPFAPRLIDSLGERTGIVRNQKAWPGEGIKGRIGMLKNDLQRIEALERTGDIDAYDREARLFAADVRVAWEHAVEEQLFGGVVMRFQRDVKAQHIRDIVITPALTKEAFDGMTETSPFHHAETMEAPAQTPTTAELRAFLARLEGFAALVKAEQKGATLAPALVVDVNRSTGAA